MREEEGGGGRRRSEPSGSVGVGLCRRLAPLLAAIGPQVNLAFYDNQSEE